MNEQRLDELVAEALVTGQVPGDASAEEREEIEAVLKASGFLAAARTQVEREATAVMPAARARFERHLAANRPLPPIAPARNVRSGFLSRFFGPNRTYALLGSAAAVGVVALLALVLGQGSFRGVETAHALELTPGDYVQATGVVGEPDANGNVTVISEGGSFVMSLSDSTSVIENEATVDVSSVKPGATVLVGGVVGENRVLAASTVALARETTTRPRILRLRELRDLRDGLSGKVTLLTLSKDGTHGIVHIDAGNGERYAVPVDGGSAAELIRRFSTALGARVTVTPGPGSTPGVFALKVQEALPNPPNPPRQPVATATLEATAAPASTAAPEGTAVKSPTEVVRPAETPPSGVRFVRIEGVIVAREGTLVRIQTERGIAVAQLRRDSVVLPGESGLTAEALLRGDTVVGHTVAISGGLDPATGRVSIDVAVLGKRPPAPQRGGQ